MSTALLCSAGAARSPCVRSHNRALGLVVMVAPNRKFAAAAGTGFLPTAQDLRAHAAFIYSYYTRFASLGWSRARARLLHRVTAVGLDHLDAVEAQGRGALLLSVHL